MANPPYRLYCLCIACISATAWPVLVPPHHAGGRCCR